ncbi:MAG: RNA methyltransferase [Bacteroidales bacterium]|jgi:TrmH family RNA methyltransferase|nr:RNA methyltransferase [Bacteroidales bacterium]
MLSKNELKFLRSLQQKKYRKEYQLFLVEGTKSVKEVIESDFVVKKVFAGQKWIEAHANELPVEITQLTPVECEQISSLQTPPEIFALVEMKSNLLPVLPEKFLMLDDIKDAGNLGTLIRTADWFGIECLVCSEQSVELYNSKTIQASMGSFAHVKVFYTDLIDFISRLPKAYTIYGAFLDGKEVGKVNFPAKSIVLIGNESKGISDALLPYVGERIFIAGQAHHPMDSLNVGAATAILCYELMK